MSNDIYVAIFPLLLLGGFILGDFGCKLYSRLKCRKCLCKTCTGNAYPGCVYCIKCKGKKRKCEDYQKVNK